MAMLVHSIWAKLNSTGFGPSIAARAVDLASFGKPDKHLMSTAGFMSDTPLDALDRGRDSSSHLVQFYDNEAFLVDSVATALGRGLEEGDSAVIIATEPHCEAIEEYLRSCGHDVAGLRKRGRLLSLDARNPDEDFARRFS